MPQDFLNNNLLSDDELSTVTTKLAKFKTPSGKIRRTRGGKRTRFSIQSLSHSVLLLGYHQKRIQQFAIAHPDDLDGKGMLGKGNFGRAKFAQDIHAKEWFVVKIEMLHKHFGLQFIDMERKVLAKLGRLVAIGQNQRKYYTVQTFIPGKTLAEVFSEKLSPNELLDIFIAACKTLKRFHEYGFLHRDLNPKNWLYDVDAKEVYLIDFGLSCEIPEFGVLKSKIKVGWAKVPVPESVNQNEFGEYEYSVNSDIYMLGKMLLLYANTKEQLPADVVMVLQRMCAENKQGRPSLDACIKLFESSKLVSRILSPLVYIGSWLPILRACATGRQAETKKLSSTEENTDMKPD